MLMSEASGEAMRRREFITFASAAVATWPLAAHAQQTERLRRIGVLMPFAANDPEAQARKLGWTVSRDLQIDYRWPGGDADSVRRDATELTALAPDVILATGGSESEWLLRATRTIP